MSPIGKIFIVLNLLLSAAFLGWAGNALTTTRDYKEALKKEEEQHKADVAAKEAELAKLQVDLNGVTDQQRQFREQRDSVQAEADRLKTQVEELKRAGESMQGNLTKIQATLGDYNNSITQLGSQKDAAVEQAHEAERQRDAAMQAQTAAELAMKDAVEKAKNADLRIGDLEHEKVALTDEVSKLNTRLEVVFAKTDLTAEEVFAQDKVDAYVLDVKRDLKLVVLNKGKKDNVKVGYTFSVYRGMEFKGQVRIQDVQEGMSSGTILNEKTPIAKGDSATTSL